MNSGLEYCVAAAGSALWIAANSLYAHGLGSFFLLIVMWSLGYCLYRRDEKLPFLPVNRVPKCQGLWITLLILFGKLSMGAWGDTYGIVPLLGLSAVFSVCFLLNKKKSTKQKVYISAAIVATSLSVVAMGILSFTSGLLPHYTVWLAVIQAPFASLMLCDQMLTISPLSFSYCEAALLAQSCLLSIIACLVPVNHLWSRNDLLPELESLFKVGILICCWLCFSTWTAALCRSIPVFYCNFFGSIGIGYAYWWLKHDADLFCWMIAFITSSMPTVILIVFWAMCTVGAMLYTAKIGALTTHIPTSWRKPFHLIIVLIYWSGCLIDPHVLLVASVIAGCVFVVAELVRLLRLPPFGSLLDEALALMRDEKDTGPLILSHFYLLVGTFLPLWMDPVYRPEDVQLRHYAGVISVGFGDAAASVMGSWLGRHKWPDSKKSIEGSICNWIAQVFAVYLIYASSKTGLINLHWTSMGYIAAACLLSSLFESFTLHMDNLVLPLFMFCLLSNPIINSLW